MKVSPPKAVIEYSEPQRLYGKIGKLKMELDWLKKSPGCASRNKPNLG